MRVLQGGSRSGAMITKKGDQSDAFILAEFQETRTPGAENHLHFRVRKGAEGRIVLRAFNDDLMPSATIHFEMESSHALSFCRALWKECGEFIIHDANAPFRLADMNHIARKNQNGFRSQFFISRAKRTIR